MIFCYPYFYCSGPKVFGGGGWQVASEVGKACVTPNVMSSDLKEEMYCPIDYVLH